MGKTFIDFGVAPYALADVCEILFNSGVTNGFITKEDNDIHIRWAYNITRGHKTHSEDWDMAKCDPERIKK